MKKHKGTPSGRFEVQIGTLVTQAWAEVQHNIIYKRSDNIVSTSTMKRMIDATNGLAITTDIMLRELERSVHKAKRELRARESIPFKNGSEFWAWFEKAYRSKMPEEERKYWPEHESAGDALIRICKRDKQGGKALLSPAGLKDFIQEKGLLEKGGSDSNIANAIMRAVAHSSKVDKDKPRKRVTYEETRPRRLERTNNKSRKRDKSTKEGRDHNRRYKREKSYYNSRETRDRSYYSSRGTRERSYYNNEDSREQYSRATT